MCIGVGEVCTVVEAEVGAAVDHIEVHRAVAVQHLGEGLGSVVSLADVMGFVPVVEPAVPEFTAHDGLIGAECLEEVQILFASAAEIGGSQIFGQGAAAQHEIGGTVRGEVQGADIVVGIDLCDSAQVILVVAVRAVLVFDLGHQDIAAVACKIGAKLVKQSFVIAGDLGDIKRVVAAQFDVVIA